MNFGEDLKKCRKEMGYSQKELAKLLGVNQSSVSDWENDVSRPDYETLFKLCLIFNVSICQLLNVDEYTYEKK